MSPTWSALGRFGTSFYIIAAVLMSSRPFLLGAHPKRWRVLSHRGKRLLIPYVVWCAVYAAFYLFTMVPQGYSLDAITLFWGPLAGTAPHLWFLPFAFLESVACVLLIPWLLRQRTQLLWILFVTLTLGAYGASYGLLPLLDREALTQLRLVRLGRYVEELPLAVGALIGIALYGRFLTRLEAMGRPRRRRLALLCAVGFVVSELGYFFLLEPLRLVFWTEIRIFANLAGALFFVACLAERNSRLLRRLAPWGQATYFAFLAHQLVLDLCKRSLSLLWGHGTLWFALLSTVFVFGVSFWLGRLVPRVRLLRWLVP